MCPPMVEAQNRMTNCNHWGTLKNITIRGQQKCMPFCNHSGTFTIYISQPLVDFWSWYRYMYTLYCIQRGTDTVYITKYSMCVMKVASAVVIKVEPSTTPGHWSVPIHKTVTSSKLCSSLSRQIADGFWRSEHQNCVFWAALRDGTAGAKPSTTPGRGTGKVRFRATRGRSGTSVFTAVRSTLQHASTGLHHPTHLFLTPTSWKKWP